MEISEERFLIATRTEADSRKTFTNFGRLIVFDLETEEPLKFFESGNDLGRILKFSPCQGVVVLAPDTFVYREASGDKNALKYARYPVREYLMR